jgi:hypothetical protein
MMCDGMSDLEDFTRWNFLLCATQKVPAWRLTDVELLAALDVCLSGAQRDLVLGELQRRLLSWPAEGHYLVAERLSALELGYHCPGRAAQDVDRLLERLLRKLIDEAGRSLALVCAASERLGRRRAAWRFLRAHGCDAAAASLVAERLAAYDRDESLISLALSDPVALGKVAVAELLADVPSFYWRVLERRSRCLSTAGVRGWRRSSTVTLGEVVFAVRRAGRRDLRILVDKALGAHPDDPSVVANALIAYATFDVRRSTSWSGWMPSKRRPGSCSSATSARSSLRYQTARPF